MTWLSKIFGNKIIIWKWNKNFFQSGAALTTFYFRMRQALFQSGGETGISKSVIVYFKVGQKLCQKEAVTSKRGKELF